MSTSNRHSELAARSCTTGAAVVDEVGTEDGPAWTMLAGVVLGMESSPGRLEAQDLAMTSDYGNRCNCLI